MAKITRCAAISVFLMFGQVQFAACADSAHGKREQSPANRPKEAPTVLEKDGQKRDFILLSESEIRKALIGRRLVVDREVDWEPNKISIAFAEDFLPDGSWIINKAIRAAITENGVWRIHDGQICTRVTQSPFGVKGRQEVCRQVWRDRSSGKIAMIGTLRILRDVLIFSSSPLK